VPLKAALPDSNTAAPKARMGNLIFTGFEERLDVWLEPMILNRLKPLVRYSI
jgi:hypothetical protein